jgi:segregation and condensation protein A
MTEETDILTETPAPGTTGGEAILIDEVTDEVVRLHLDKFEGPLEVLLYLIKAQEIDIFDIPIVKITDQYLRFLELMRGENLDVTGEFLVMAATLIQIKSRMLLPKDLPLDEEDDDDVEEEDPRLELVSKLIEYRKYRDITQLLQTLEDERERCYTRQARVVIEPEETDEQEMLEVTLFDLTEAFRNVLRYFTDDLVHTVMGEEASVDQKIEHIEQIIARDGSLSWTELFRGCRSRVEIVCCFLAILELCRMGRLRAHQQTSFEEIRLFSHDRADVQEDMAEAPVPVAETTDAPEA